MSNNFVQVAPNSTGVKLQTFENTIGGNVVDAEAVALVDTAGVSILGTAGTANADVLTVQGISGGTNLSVSQATASALNATVIGAGTAGTPSGGVVSIQGVASGTTVPVTGTITAVTAITNALPAGTNTIGNVVEVPATSGGLTTSSAALSGATVAAVKASAGQVYGYYLDNTENTATTYFQVFNAAAGSVTLGTTAPLFSLAIPSGGCANLSLPQGIVFSTAISIAQTTTRAGSTAPASNTTYTIWYA